jgi:hypothetical protein
MSKKQLLDTLAAVLRANKPSIDGPVRKQWQMDCCAVADACRDSDLRFDVGKFLSACGVQ